MPDVFLYSVPSDANTVDVRLRDPTVAAGAGGITGSLAAVEGQDTGTFGGVLVYSGSLAAVEGQDIAAFAGKLVYSGALTATEAQDAATFSGALVYAGTLAATEAQDVAAFEGAVSGAQRLHGRRVRGRRIEFTEELENTAEVAPVEAKETRRPELPSLEPVAKAIEEAKAGLTAARKGRLERKLGEAQASYNDARDRENAIIQRLRDEDEFWLLAA